MSDAVVALILVVSPLAFEAVLLFMLLFCFRTGVLPRTMKECSEVGEVNAIRDERTESAGAGS